MIPVTDLRIGNILKIEKKICYVTDINSLSTPRRVEFKHSKNVVGTITSDDIQEYAIPITSEWLIKLGFSKSARPNCDDIYKDLNQRMVLWFNEGSYAEMDLIQDDKRISFKHSHIKYIHQLQNLYYTLTGAELTIQQPQIGD